MASTPENIREHLSALRIEREGVPVRSRRWVRWVVVAAVLLVGGVLAGRRIAAGRVPTIEAAPVTVTSGGAAGGMPVLSGAGYVVSADRYISIGVRVGGRIDRYLVEEGDHVKQGDPLVQIDDREYRAAVARAEANVRLAKAEANLAKQKRERAEGLRIGVISREEVDIRRAEADTAAAKVGTAEAELVQARVALEYTTLRAPRSGVILAKYKEVGEIATPGGFSGSGDLIRMANLEDLRAEVDVNESDLHRIAMGQDAEVLPDAYPDASYPAKVVKLYPQVNRQKGTLKIEVQIPKHDGRLLPDMSVRINFLAEARPAAPGAPLVLVPRAVLRQDDRGAFVWTIVDGRARRAPVTVGTELGDRVQITQGANAGDVLVTGDATRLADGTAVHVTADAPH
jgi:RND family efflux transporter MFP subunit